MKQTSELPEKLREIAAAKREVRQMQLHGEIGAGLFGQAIMRADGIVQMLVVNPALWQYILEHDASAFRLETDPAALAAQRVASVWEVPLFIHEKVGERCVWVGSEWLHRGWRFTEVWW